MNGRKLKALLVLSIVFPVGLLTALRFTGTLQGPKEVSETLTGEIVKWQFGRPDGYVWIGRDLEAFFQDDALISSETIKIWDFLNRPLKYGGPVITLSVAIDSTVADSKGFIYSVDVVFRNDSQPSSVAPLRTYFSFTNLSLVSVKEDANPEAFTKGYIDLAGTGRPREIYFSTTVEWSLLDASSDQTHQIEVAYELTFYNGTVYKKIIQPFEVTVLGS